MLPEFAGELIEDKENFIVQPFIELLEREEFAQTQMIITGASFVGSRALHADTLLSFTFRTKGAGSKDSDRPLVDLRYLVYGAGRLAQCPSDPHAQPLSGGSPDRTSLRR
jgi:hypothetical protein